MAIIFHHQTIPVTLYETLMFLYEVISFGWLRLVGQLVFHFVFLKDALVFAINKLHYLAQSIKFIEIAPEYKFIIWRNLRFFATLRQKIADYCRALVSVMTF